MNKLIFLSLIICIISCSKKEIIEDTVGTRLISIEYSDVNNDWVENYSYSSNSELLTIEDFRSLGRRYEIEYLNNKLKEYSIFQIDDDKLIFRDSIKYDENNNVEAIYKFSINSGENLPLSLICEFKYDDSNRVLKKSTYSILSQEYFSIEKYFWTGENITRVEYYDSDEELRYEYFYKYDDKVNYKKNLQIGISDPINLCRNNVVEMNWSDHYGNLDLICSPCITEYHYNLDDYPVFIKHYSGRELNLEYD